MPNVGPTNILMQFSYNMIQLIVSLELHIDAFSQGFEIVKKTISLVSS